jgi:hypothetical protein
MKKPMHWKGRRGEVIKITGEARSLDISRVNIALQRAHAQARLTTAAPQPIKPAHLTTEPLPMP